MADEGPPRHEPAHGLVRARGAAGGRGDDHEGSLPVARVVLYTAAGCGLCARALEVVREVQADPGLDTRFELEVVSIDGDPQLEARYREHLPVLEIDGERAFTYFVEPAALRARLAR